MAANPIEIILPLLQNVKKSGAGWSASCPNTSAHKHGDKHPSLTISVGNDGKVLLHCKAGCTVNQICAALGIPVSALFPKPLPQNRYHLTIEELAQAKALPADFLRNLGLCEDDFGVIIPYLDLDDTPQRQRKRIHVVAKQGSLWEGQGKIIPYGLWRIAKTNLLEKMFLVEGESDSWTLWFHNYPALGIPGAQMTNILLKEHVQRLNQLYLVQETDEGGKTFVQGILARLDKLGWQGEGFIVKMELAGNGILDINDLHRKYGPEKFAGVFQDIIKQATLVKPPLLPKDNFSKTPVPKARKELSSSKMIAGSRTYFFDVKEATDGTKYFVISESKQDSQGAYQHSRVMVFQEHLKAFSEAFNKAIQSLLKQKAFPP